MCELPREKNQRNFGSNNSVCVYQYNIMSTAGVKKTFYIYANFVSRVD